MCPSLHRTLHVMVAPAFLGVLLAPGRQSLVMSLTIICIELCLSKFKVVSVSCLDPG